MNPPYRIIKTYEMIFLTSLRIKGLACIISHKIPMSKVINEKMVFVAQLILHQDSISADLRFVLGAVIIKIIG